ncbi:hypothetical protein GCM10023116_33270 [Kistimonas scapharcae]|uniref:DUF4842 domain-containing protein n=1 Tax=Kistimonas scapharcae TaxID=1036133 RepID=A0ABP8V6K2_9GAMM
MTALIISPLCFSERFGDVSNGNSISDSATVCMSVGLYGAISNLDNIHLSTTGADGAAGTSYEGNDTFHVDSNGGVRITVTGNQLTNGSDTIRTYYFIDDNLGQVSTQEGETHNSDHQVKVLAQLNNISSQKAGSYNGQLQITLSPLIGGSSGCGESAQSMPINEEDTWAFMAFEDLYPNPGDADYNDFVMAFNATESYDANGGLDTIAMSFVPLARGAGYNHSIWLDLDGVIDMNNTNITTETDPLYQGDASIKVTYTNLENNNVSTKYYDIDDDIPIFHNTRSTLDGYANVYDWQSITYPKLKTDIEITMADSTANLLSERGSIHEGSYRVYMHVNNTNSDIDLAAVNPDDGMIDSNGYPFGLVVPGGWQWPLEKVNINQAYQYFDDYRSWLTGESPSLSFEAENWFYAPDTSGLVYSQDNIDILMDYIETFSTTQE